MSTAAAQIREATGNGAWLVLDTEQSTALADLLDAITELANSAGWISSNSVIERALALEAALSRQPEPGATP